MVIRPQCLYIYIFNLYRISNMMHWIIFAISFIARPSCVILALLWATVSRWCVCGGLKISVSHPCQNKAACPEYPPALSKVIFGMQRLVRPTLEDVQENTSLLAFSQLKKIAFCTCVRTHESTRTNTWIKQTPELSKQSRCALAPIPLGASFARAHTSGTAVLPQDGTKTSPCL